MTYSSKVSLLLIVAGTLSAASISPRTTYKVISKPSRMIAAHKHELRLQKIRAEWDDRQQRAANGDPEAMLRVGQVMRRAHLHHSTGVEPDSVQGAAYIREAAAADYPGALLAVWILDGADTAALPGIATRIIELSAGDRTLGELSGWLHWYGIESCNREYVEVNRKASEARIAEHAEWADAIQTQTSKFEKEFEETCSAL